MARGRTDLIYPRTAAQLALASAATAFAVLSVGALALGVLAIGRLAVGRMRLREGHFKRLSIEEFEIGRLRVINQG